MRCITLCIHYNNKQYPLEINNQFISVLHFKQIILSKLNLNFKNEHQLILSTNNKIMNDNKTLYYYKLTNGSDVHINYKLKGGQTDGVPIQVILIICWVIALLIFFITMITGLIPIFSNVFYYIIQFSIQNVLGWFISAEQKLENVENQINNNIQSQQNTTNNMQKQLADIVRKQFIEYDKIQNEKKERHSGIFGAIRMLLDIGLFILQNIIVFVGIYTASALLIVPYILYVRGSTRCTALNIGHWVGITMAFIYYIIYGIFLNGFDAVVYAYSDVIEQLPDNILTAYLTPLIYGYKDTFDEVKIASVPIIGEILTAVDGIMISIKQLLDQTDVFGCDGAKLDEFKKFIYHIAYVNSDEKMGVLYNNQQIVEPKAGDFTQNIIYREQIKNFRLYALTRLVAGAFNDYQMNEKQTIYDNMCLFQKIFNFGWWDYISKIFIYNSTCRFFQVVDLIVKFIDNMGGALGVSNMIKSGSLTGMCAIIAYIVILILAIFLNSMYGINF